MGGKQNTCCFSGHRPAKLPWGLDETDERCAALKRRIADAVESAAEEGYTHFICGMAMGCDFYFAEAVLALRGRREGVTLEAAIPCLSQSDGWPSAEQTRYARILAACDCESVIQERYTPDCMQRRNRYMVDHASLLIAANDGLPGGTRSTILYALRRGVNVADIPI